jgi:hypothetical protein
MSRLRRCCRCALRAACYVFGVWQAVRRENGASATARVRHDNKHCARGRNRKECGAYLTAEVAAAARALMVAARSACRRRDARRSVIFPLRRGLAVPRRSTCLDDVYRSHPRAACALLAGSYERTCLSP